MTKYARKLIQEDKTRLREEKAKLKADIAKTKSPKKLVGEKRGRKKSVI
jgi:hypothetical protein